MPRKILSHSEHVFSELTVPGCWSSCQPRSSGHHLALPNGLHPVCLRQQHPDRRRPRPAGLPMVPLEPPQSPLPPADDRLRVPPPPPLARACAMCMAAHLCAVRHCGWQVPLARILSVKAAHAVSNQQATPHAGTRHNTWWKREREREREEGGGRKRGTDDKRGKRRDRRVQRTAEPHQPPITMVPETWRAMLSGCRSVRCSAGCARCLAPPPTSSSPHDTTRSSLT